MSGIVGIWNLDGEPVDRALLLKLASVQSHRNADGSGIWIDGDIGLVFQNLWVTPESVGEIQPFVCDSENVVLFDGRLDNREELLPLLSGSVSSESSDAAFVSAAYRKFGDGLPERLAGDFALTLLDVRERKLLLVRDAVGMRPLYYAQLENTVLIASEIKPILAHPGVSVKPNDDMLAAYLMACFGEDREGWTFFEGVTSLPPGQTAIVTARSFKRRTYFQFGNWAPIRFRSFEEYTEAFRHYFQQSVRRRTRSAFPVAVSLSGGLDSSSIFCAAETLRRRDPGKLPRVEAVSVVGIGPASDESVFLDDIERQYDVRIERVRASGFHNLRGMERLVWDIEAPATRSPVDPNNAFNRTVRQLGARVLLTGHGGDEMLAGRGYLVDLFYKLRWLEIRNHLKEVSRWRADDPTAFTKEFLRELIRCHIPGKLMPSVHRIRKSLSRARSWHSAALRNRVPRVESLQRFKNSGKSVHQKSLYALTKPMYYVQGFEWSNKFAALSGLEPACPFFDRELVSFLMAIPGEASSWKGVPKAILRAAMQRELPQSIAERRWKAETTQEYNDAMIRDLDGLMHRVGEHSLAVKHGYVDRDSLNAQAAALGASISPKNCAAALSLSDLFGLEIWLELFLERANNLEEVFANVSATI